MTHFLTERQEDALREVANMGSAKAASMLARLVGDVGVLVDVPVVLSATRVQLGWLLGGRDVKVHAVTFGIEGEVSGQLWWVLREPDAARLGQRLLARPGITGPLSSSSSNSAVTEAANIVASACLSAMGTLVHASLVPSTPQVLAGPVKTLVGDDADFFQTVLAANFTSTNTPSFSGWLVLMFDGFTTDRVLERLGV